VLDIQKIYSLPSIDIVRTVWTKGSNNTPVCMTRCVDIHRYLLVRKQNNVYVLHACSGSLLAAIIQGTFWVGRAFSHVIDGAEQKRGARTYRPAQHVVVLRVCWRCQRRWTRSLERGHSLPLAFAWACFWLSRFKKSSDSSLLHPPTRPYPEHHDCTPQTRMQFVVPS
jgi:hypothetical protein